ncbi:MAG: hypothetical protein ABUK01_18570 [Leptospirales bacterium]
MRRCVRFFGVISGRTVSVTADHLSKATKTYQRLEQERIKILRLTGEDSFLPSVFDDILIQLSDFRKRGRFLRIILVILPLDVQVSAEEWKKYNVNNPIDMRPSLKLLDILTIEANKLKIEVLDATQTLKKAEPGAFLYGDLHMSAKGHEAVAKSIYENFFH